MCVYSRNNFKCMLIRRYLILLINFKRLILINIVLYQNFISNLSNDTIKIPIIFFKDVLFHRNYKKKKKTQLKINL